MRKVTLEVVGTVQRWEIQIAVFGATPDSSNTRASLFPFMNTIGFHQVAESSRGKSRLVFVLGLSHSKIDFYSQPYRGDEAHPTRPTICKLRTLL